MNDDVNRIKEKLVERASLTPVERQELHVLDDMIRAQKAYNEILMYCQRQISLIEPKIERAQNNNPMKEERKTVCCLNDNVRIDPRRRTGNTTRLVNEAINIIFEGHICLVKDHCDTRDTNSELFDKIIDRLWSEHSTLLEDGLIENDEKALTINLKQ